LKEKNIKSARIIVEVSDEEADETVMELRNTEPLGDSITNEMFLYGCHFYNNKDLKSM
jgi:hypothetical protein